MYIYIKDCWDKKNERNGEKEAEIERDREGEQKETITEDKLHLQYQAGLESQCYLGAIPACWCYVLL